MPINLPPMAAQIRQGGILLWILKGHFCLLWSCLTLFSFYTAWLSSNTRRIWQINLYKIPRNEWFLWKHKLQISLSKLHLALTGEMMKLYLLFITLLIYFYKQIHIFVTLFDLVQPKLWSLSVRRNYLNTCLIIVEPIYTVYEAHKIIKTPWGKHRTTTSGQSVKSGLAMLKAPSRFIFFIHCHGWHGKMHDTSAFQKWFVPRICKLWHHNIKVYNVMLIMCPCIESVNKWELFLKSTSRSSLCRETMWYYVFYYLVWAKNTVNQTESIFINTYSLYTQAHIYTF